MARKGDFFLKVENATSAFLATCLLLLATALGQLWRCRAFAHLYAVDFRGFLLRVYALFSPVVVATVFIQLALTLPHALRKKRVCPGHYRGKSTKVPQKVGSIAQAI
jgi:hypothetical protein